MSKRLCRASLCCALWLLALPAVRAADADAVALAAAVQAERTRDPAPRFPREAFLVQPGVRSVVLSPEGRRVAYLRMQGRERSVWVWSSDAGTSRQLLARTEADNVQWSHDGRWLLLQADDRLYALPADGQGRATLVSPLGGTQRRELLAVDPTQPAAVIVREVSSTAPGQVQRWRLLRIDPRGGRTLLSEDTARPIGFALDPRGTLAYLQRVDGAALVTLRRGSRGEWQPFLRCPDLHLCALLPRTTPQGEPLLLTDLAGDRCRLVRVDALGALHTLHTDPRDESDLDSLVLDPRDGAPLVANYDGTTSASYGLTADARAALAELGQRLAHRRLELAFGWDGQAHWLVGERGSALQGERWHLFDAQSGQLRDILSLPPQTSDGRPTQWLPEAAMGRQYPLAWRASDGMRLHGFLWLPPGRDPRALPLVALIHGGPWNSVRAEEFRGIAQFLVNRGYAVFEPNFRGSTGYGRLYVRAARGDFGNGRVQQDIVEGVRWLLGQGVGDGRRVGIVGASFGGYATLLGVTFQPELFKVGVAIVPPPDFAWDMRWVARSLEALSLSNVVPFEDWLRLLSLDLHDPVAMARLHAQSPLANAARMTRPLLLLAGGADHRVAIRGVLGYAARLKVLGKDVSLLVDAQAGHANARPLAQEAQLYLIALMLHRHLGGAAPAPPDPALRDELRRGLRIAGHDLRAAGLAPRGQP